MHYQVGAIILFITLATSLSARAQTSVAPEHVQQRVAELRERFNSMLRDMTRRGVDEEVTVRALLAIVEEESQKGARGSTFHQALEELGHFPDNRDAVRALVGHIDTGESSAPRFRGDPLEGYTAAEALVKCGRRARLALFDALAQSRSERHLHLIAYVLVKLDQDQAPFDVEVTALRLRRQLKYIEAIADNVTVAENMQLRNVQRIIEIIEAPGFKRLIAFPPPDK